MEIILAWFYYSKIYIIGSIFITMFLNKITNKLYMPPLIINMISILLILLIPYKERTYAMYFSYMPVVTFSILTNFCIYIFRKFR